MNKHKKPLVIYIGIGAVVILLNVVAWNSTAFCDAYIETVFPLWVNTYGRLTGLVPFSVGEIMLVLGVVLVGLAAMVWIVCFSMEMRLRIELSFVLWYTKFSNQMRNNFQYFRRIYHV